MSESWTDERKAYEADMRAQPWYFRKLIHTALCGALASTLGWCTS